MDIKKQNPFFQAAQIMNEFANCNDKQRAIQQLNAARARYARFNQQDAIVFVHLQKVFRQYHGR